MYSGLSIFQYKHSTMVHSVWYLSLGIFQNTEKLQRMSRVNQCISTLSVSTFLIQCLKHLFLIFNK